MNKHLFCISRQKLYIIFRLNTHTYCLISWWGKYFTKRKDYCCKTWLWWPLYNYKCNKIYWEKRKKDYIVITVLQTDFLVLFFRATPEAYRSSQARGQSRAAVARLHHSHSNNGSKPCLQRILQLTWQWILNSMTEARDWTWAPAVPWRNLPNYKANSVIFFFFLMATLVANVNSQTRD